jgi:Raf kinase inhibitor-like YbhB/YbcL family protein
MRLESPAFAHDARIPPRHTCDGDDVSPALRWSGAPAGTQSFALLVLDPDAPRGTFTHWVLYDLDPTLAELPEGAEDLGRAGRNDFQHPGWGGPCPPPGHGDHRYRFRLYALDVRELGLGVYPRREDVERSIEGHVLAEAELVGRYLRRAR